MDGSASDIHIRRAEQICTFFFYPSSTSFFIHRSDGQNLFQSYLLNQTASTLVYYGIYFCCLVPILSDVFHISVISLYKGKGETPWEEVSVHEINFQEIQVKKTSPI